MNISDRNGAAHDPLDVADRLDQNGDRAGEAGEWLHDAADVVRGLRYKLFLKPQIPDVPTLQRMGRAELLELIEKLR